MDRPPFWETLAYAEFRRAQLNRRGGSDLHFWNDRSREADFLLHRGGRFRLADAKWTERPRRRDADVLRRVASVLPAGAVDGMAIVCRTSNPYPIGDGVDALPLEAVAVSAAWH